VTWAPSMPILVFLGLSVLDLGPMYATDVTQHHRFMPPFIRGGGTIKQRLKRNKSLGHKEDKTMQVIRIIHLFIYPPPHTHTHFVDTYSDNSIIQLRCHELTRIPLYNVFIVNDNITKIIHSQDEH